MTEMYEIRAIARWYARQLEASSSEDEVDYDALSRASSWIRARTDGMMRLVLDQAEGSRLLAEDLGRELIQQLGDDIDVTAAILAELAPISLDEMRSAYKGQLIQRHRGMTEEPAGEEQVRLAAASGHHVLERGLRALIYAIPTSVMIQADGSLLVRGHVPVSDTVYVSVLVVCAAGSGAVVVDGRDVAFDSAVERIVALEYATTLSPSIQVDGQVVASMAGAQEDADAVLVLLQNARNGDHSVAAQLLAALQPQSPAVRFGFLDALASLVDALRPEDDDD